MKKILCFSILGLALTACQGSSEKAVLSGDSTAIDSLDTTFSVVTDSIVSDSIVVDTLCAD